MIGRSMRVQYKEKWAEGAHGTYQIQGSDFEVGTFVARFPHLKVLEIQVLSLGPVRKTPAYWIDSAIDIISIFGKWHAREYAGS